MATDKFNEATAAVAVPVARLRAVLEDPTVPYQHIVVSLAVSVFFFETYIKLRQIPHLRRKEPPKELAAYLDDGGAEKDEAAKRQEFLKAQAYALDKLKFGLFANAVNLVETVLLTSSALAPLFAGSSHGPWSGYSGLWSLAERLSATWASKAPEWINFGTGEVPTSLMFLTLMTALGSVTGLPADLWKQFVLEEKHGFNKQTLKLWCLDQVKVLALNAVLGLPICAALISLVRWAGEAFVQWTMLFVLGLVLVMYILGPYMIMPLFNKFTRLDSLPDHRDVTDRTRALAGRLRFPLKTLWVIDGSKRSSHSNAFFFGLPGLARHIVLFDTLLKQASPEQIEAILAHELGHWSLYHTTLLMGVMFVQVGFSLSVFRFFLWNPSLFGSFGFPPLASPSRSLLSSLPFLSSTVPPRATHPLLIGFLLSSHLFHPLSTILTFAVHALSRALEYQADGFAKRLGYAEALKWALVRITLENKATTSNDWLYSMFHHSHPTLLERVAALESDPAKRD